MFLFRQDQFLGTIYVHINGLECFACQEDLERWQLKVVFILCDACLWGAPAPGCLWGGPSYGLAGRPTVPRTQSMDLNFRKTWRQEIALQLLPKTGIPPPQAPRLDGVGQNGHCERV